MAQEEHLWVGVGKVHFQMHCLLAVTQMPCFKELKYYNPPHVPDF